MHLESHALARMEKFPAVVLVHPQRRGRLRNLGPPQIDFGWGAWGERPPTASLAMPEASTPQSRLIARRGNWTPRLALLVLAPVFLFTCARVRPEVPSLRRTSTATD